LSYIAIFALFGVLAKIHIIIDGADASRRVIVLRITIRFLSRRYAPGHQAVAADSRPRKQAIVSVSR
jgi:hypothetical protein